MLGQRLNTSLFPPSVLSHYCVSSRSMFNFVIFFFFNDTATTEIYTLSLHDALPIWGTMREKSPLAARWLNLSLFVHAIPPKIGLRDAAGGEGPPPLGARSGEALSVRDPA